MSSTERDDVRANELIERLLLDPEFRAEFRRDPVAACAAAGLPDLAAELAGSGGSMETLVVRESRSSLAGVVMAVAVEGMSVAEAQALVQHGLTGAPHGHLKPPHGGLKLPPSGVKLPHGGALHNPLGHVQRAASPAGLERELRGGSPGQAADAAATPAASASPVSAASPVSPHAPVSAPPASPPPPEPGAQPARGGAVPAWPDAHSAGAGPPAGSPGSHAAPDAPPGGGAAGGGAAIGADGPAGGGAAIGAGGPAASLAGVLDSPRLAAPPDVRAFLTAGGADPRLVQVLGSVLANHSIGLGQVTALTEPVHAQAVSIVSVDGQPVGPANFAARDLVTELAALDPSLRPSEIGTPWPIHAAGFFTDPSQQAQLHLAFVSSADYQPPSGSGLAPVGAPAAAEPPAAAAAPAPAAAPTPAAAPAPADAITPAPAPPGPTPASASGVGHYVNPLPSSAVIGRTDMGVDANMNPGDPIVAPGTSRVLGIMPNWYRGQPYVALQLLDGPMKGHNYYLAEQINLNVSVGQVVQQGQPIAHYAASGTGIEIGWAGANWEQTLAQATSGYSEGDHTPAGTSFRTFLDSVGHGGAPGSSAPGAAVPDQDTNAGPDPDANAGPDPDANAGAAPPGPPAAPAPAASPAVPVAPPVAPAAPPSNTPFAVLESPHNGRVRPTVQFLPAVRPSPGSPLYEPPSGQTVDQPPGPSAAAQPAPAAPVDQPAAAPIDEALAAPTPTGSLSVSSSLLTQGQQKFAGRLAELTGLDPRVVAAWELAEESGGAAQTREQASNFNWLNIGYFDSGAGKIAFDRTFSDPISAAEQSAKFLKGEWGGASPSIRAILSSVGHSPDEQMAAIANSDWASSHYGGGANLHGTYDELSDIRIEKSANA